jgi:imidazolonepropionase-like amidohydrolase
MSQRKNWAELLTVGAVAIGVSLGFAERTEAQVVAVKAGTLHTGAGDPIENGIVLIEDGRIIGVGPGLVIPSDATVYELEEGHITAGLIDANARVERQDIFLPQEARPAGDLSAFFLRQLPFHEDGAACVTCSGFASCPLTHLHGEFSTPEDNQEIEELGCPCCGWPSHNLTQILTAGVQPAVTSTESSSEVVPHTSVLDVANLRSQDYGWLARGGVTTVFVAPDTSAVIGPQGAIVTTFGSIRDRVLSDSSDVQAVIGSDPYAVGLRNARPFGQFVNARTRRPTTRMGVTWVFRKAFYDTQDWMADRQITGSDQPPVEAYPILSQILSGDVPLRILARDRNDIEAAVRLAGEFDLSFTLVEATSAYECWDVLTSLKPEIVFGPISDGRVGLRRFSGDENNAKLGTIRELFARGWEPAISAQDMRDEEGLAGQAMMAIKAGATFDQALRAVTVNPARILRMSDEMGSVEVGKRADLVLWTGKPFEATTSAAVVIVGGRVAVNNLGN